MDEQHRAASLASNMKSWLQACFNGAQGGGDVPPRAPFLLTKSPPSFKTQSASQSNGQSVAQSDGIYLHQQLSDRKPAAAEQTNKSPNNKCDAKARISPNWAPPSQTSYLSACSLSAASRKYSLPAQLDAADPSHRGNGVSGADGAGESQQVRASPRTPTLSQSAQHERERFRHRASQTLTRQLSFWHDDNYELSPHQATTSQTRRQSEIFYTTQWRSHAANQSADLLAVDMNNLELGVAANAAAAAAAAAAATSTLDRMPNNLSANPSTRSGASQSNSICDPAPMSAAKPHEQQPTNGESKPTGAGSLLQRRPGATISRLFSSSSTSSAATSSPSPDFGRPRERILARAPKSAPISKRHLFSRLRSRRQQQQRQPDEKRCSVDQGLESSNDLSRKVDGKRAKCKLFDSSQSSKSSGEQDDESLAQIDAEFLNLPVERRFSDVNSASLERQCRDLWKLRANLHKDSCRTDNWTNYHQRLNRRYDSGYKSIEHQLSSSIEGSLASAGHNWQSSGDTGDQLAAVQVAKTQVDVLADYREPNRPPSGCSGLISRPIRVEEVDEEQLQARDCHSRSSKGSEKKFGRDC